MAALDDEETLSKEDLAEDFPKPGPDWYSKLFGFHEVQYEQTKELFLLRGTRLFSRANGKGYEIGKFETPSLEELRERVLGIEDLKEKCGGKLEIKNIISEVSVLHSLEENRFATFQVASQFNCLEFVGPSVVPEDGITAYIFDRTQGPACSICCGPATVYRNYFATVGDSQDSGQTRSRMIDNLKDVCEYIDNNPDGRYFRRKGGYTLADDSGLRKLNLVLQKLGEDDPNLDEVKKRLRIGLQKNAQVTGSHWGSRLNKNTNQQVSQVFGSACSISYSRNTCDLWAPFAKLVLQASYEATLLAGIESMYEHNKASGSNYVFLTLLGGGVFGNKLDWIYDAIIEACKKYKDYDLKVKIIFKYEIAEEFANAEKILEKND